MIFFFRLNLQSTKHENLRIYIRCFYFCNVTITKIFLTSLQINRCLVYANLSIWKYFITIILVICAFDTNTKKIDKQNCLLIIIKDIHGHTYSLSIRPGFWSTTNFWMLLHKLYRSLDDTIHNLVCLTSINLNHLNFETWITYARWIVTHIHTLTYIHTHTYSSCLWKSWSV